jgi:UDP-2,4-diacetamido-2,4,6-trideoxy-beta-L-altropyranose hydrolase
MNIVIRCDSSTKIGSGHLIRCVTLGQILSSLGHKIHFFYRGLPGAIDPISLGLNFAGDTVSRRIPVAFSLTEEVSFIKAAALPPGTKGLVVVDHYSLDANWEREFDSEFGVWVVDDLANRPHQCHILLDYNFRGLTENPYENLTPKGCQFLIGPEFCLLRPEFQAVRNRILAKDSGIERKFFHKALAFFGGTDATGESLRFAKDFDGSKTSMQWNLLVSPHNKHYETLAKFPSKSGLQLLCNPSSVAEVFAEHDVYLGSGGTVTWERAYLGLSGYVCATADNQIPSSQALAKAGYQEFLGPAQNLDFGSVLTRIEADLQSDKLKSYSLRSSRLVNLLSPAQIQKLLPSL